MSETVVVGSLLEVVADKVHALEMQGISPAFLVVGESSYRMLVVEMNDFIQKGRIALRDDRAETVLHLHIVHSSVPNVLEVAGFNLRALP